MPKMKSNRSAAKRFKVTGTGKVRRRHAGMRHILSTKTRKRKRHARRGDMVAGSDLRAVHRLLPYGF